MMRLLQSNAGLVALAAMMLIAMAMRGQADNGPLPSADVAHGKVLFQQSCAICHAVALGPDGGVVIKQGPSLVDVVGRKAGTGDKFSYTPALMTSGLRWDAPTLDRFLTDPPAAVPGTTMPIKVADPNDRTAIIAYLTTLTGKGDVSMASAAPPAPTGATPASNASDWQNAAPGAKYRIDVAHLPAPYATTSAETDPSGAPRPAGAELAVPPGFTVKAFATGFSNCR